MIHVLDTLQGGRARVIAATLLELPDGSLALVDCGPDAVFANLRAALEKMGRAVTEVRHLLLTHVHLDHAGAAWRFAREAGATVYVHPRGAAHLADPGKLLASAQRIYGDDMDRLWGRVEGVPADRIHVAADGARLRLAPGVEVEVLATPGHAQHHNAYRLERTVFTGDVAGVRIGHGPVVPPCPPPDIDLETWHDSLQRLRQINPETFYLTHFGAVHEPRAALDEMEARLRRWADWMKDALNAGGSEEALVPRFEASVHDELLGLGLDEREVADYELADPAFMSVAGLSRYWRKHHPEALRGGPTGGAPGKASEKAAGEGPAGPNS